MSQVGSISTSMMNSNVEALMRYAQSVGVPQQHQAFELPERIVESERNDTLFRFACSMQAKGDSDQAILEQLHNANNSRCVPKLSSQEVDAIFEHVTDTYAKGEAKPQKDASGLYLPSWEPVRAETPPRRAPGLIDGVVRQGKVMLISGKGKIGKSMFAIELCVAIAAGRFEWLGFGLGARGACLYIDPELDPATLDNRFSDVCKAMGADPTQVDRAVKRWCLRGIPAANLVTIQHDLSERSNHGEFTLLVIDSASAFVRGDENSSVDVRAFFTMVFQLAETTGAAVLLVHHFGKAKDGDRGAADRARGSSVWFDAPDAVLTLTEVFPPSGEPGDYLPEKHYACLLEAGGLRDFGRMDPVPLVFGYPLHTVDAEGITDGWKPNSSQRAGGQKSGERSRAKAEARSTRCELALMAEFVERQDFDAIPGTEAAEVVGERLGEAIKAQTLKTYLEASEVLKVEQVSRQRWCVKPAKAIQEHLDLN